MLCIIAPRVAERMKYCHIWGSLEGEGAAEAWDCGRQPEMKPHIPF